MAAQFAAKQRNVAKAEYSQHLNHSHDYVCLNFSSNLAAAMFGCNRRCGVVGYSFQVPRVSGLDLVANELTDLEWSAIKPFLPN